MIKETTKEIAKTEEQSGTPAQMIRLAVDKGADLDKLEKLLTLQERWDRNEARKAYNEAMALFKANPPKIDKDRTVKYKDVRYNHASLFNVTERINSELSKYGLSSSWTTKQNGGVTVTCKITHSKGHTEETTLTAQPDTTGSKNSIQAIGSTITYLERYTLLALTGLATFDQDDDGKTTQVKCVDDKQRSQLLDLIADKGIAIEKFCKAFGIAELTKFPKSRYDEAIAALNKKVSK